jgi:hypothetical protein
MSIAIGFSAMIDAITITNSGNPIGRWLEATKALALVSDNEKPSCGAQSMDLAAMHNQRFGMAARRHRNH